MSQIILVTRPTAGQPISIHSPYELLTLRNLAFETLLVALRRLDPQHYHSFLVRSLAIILDAPEVDELPTIALAELLFALLDSTTEAMAIINIQNVLIYSAGMLNGCAD